MVPILVKETGRRDTAGMLGVFLFANFAAGHAGLVLAAGTSGVTSAAAAPPAWPVWLMATVAVEQPNPEVTRSPRPGHRRSPQVVTTTDTGR
jgi:hypothetical protein